METVTENRTFTIKEIADQLGVSKRSIRRYLERLGITGHVVHNGARPELRLEEEILDRLKAFVHVETEALDRGDQGTEAPDSCSTSCPGPETEADQSKNRFQAAPVSAPVRAAIADQGDRGTRALAVRGVTRDELIDALTVAFTAALEKIELPAPAKSGPGRVLEAAAYAAAILGVTVTVALVLALAARSGLVALPF